MKGPVGECRYCGQEFMSKQGLARHEAEVCEQREQPVRSKQVRPWRRRVQVAPGKFGWIRANE